MRQLDPNGSRTAFPGQIPPKKTSGAAPKPVKPYNFAIEDASDRSMRLVLAVSGHALQHAGPRDSRRHHKESTGPATTKIGKCWSEDCWSGARRDYSRSP